MLDKLDWIDQKAL